jgi:hypothetical protein
VHAVLEREVVAAPFQMVGDVGSQRRDIVGVDTGVPRVERHRRLIVAPEQRAPTR